MSRRDPLTRELVKNAIDSIVDEMAYTVVRTARSEIVKDVMDYSTALCDADGRMVAQAKTIALHLGAVPEAMAAVGAAFGDDLRPGDVIDRERPVRGRHASAGHLHVQAGLLGPRRLRAGPIVVAITPTWAGACRAPTPATRPRSTRRACASRRSSSTTPARPDRTLIRLLEKNVRVPDRVLGDLRAQYAACRIGERRLSGAWSSATAATIAGTTSTTCSTTPSA